MEKFKDLITELISDLTSELESEPTFQENILAAKVKNSVREVYEIRNQGYPIWYTDDMVIKDIESLYSKIRGRALFYYNQTGAEGQTSHVENGVNIHFGSIDKLYPIRPFTKII